MGRPATADDIAKLDPQTRQFVADNAKYNTSQAYFVDRFGKVRETNKGTQVISLETMSTAVLERKSPLRIYSRSSVEPWSRRLHLSR